MEQEINGLVVKENAMVINMTLIQMEAVFLLLREELVHGQTQWDSITSKERQQSRPRLHRHVDGRHTMISSLVDALKTVNNSLSLQMLRQLVESKQHVVELLTKADMETNALTMMDPMQV